MEIITTSSCHSWNVPFYQLVNTRARGIPLPLKFHRVAQMLLIYAGVKFYGVDTLRYLTLFDVLKNTDFEF